MIIVWCALIVFIFRGDFSLILIGIKHVQVRNNQSIYVQNMQQIFSISTKSYWVIMECIYEKSIVV